MKLQRREKARTQSQLGSYAGTGNRRGAVSAMELPHAVNQMPLQGGFFLAGLVDAFHQHQSLLAVTGEKCLVLQHAGKPDNGGLFHQPCQAVRLEHLAAGGFNHQIRIGVCKRLTHKRIEAVENGEDNDERRRANSHAHSPYSRNHVDDMVRLPGEQVTEGYFERQSHFFSNSSICSA